MERKSLGSQAPLGRSFQATIPDGNRSMKVDANTRFSKSPRGLRFTVSCGCADRAALPVGLHFSETSCRLRQRVRNGAPLGTLLRVLPGRAARSQPMVHGREKTIG